MEDNTVVSKKSFVEKAQLFFVKPSLLFEDYIKKPTWFLKTVIYSIAMTFFTLVSLWVGKDEYIDMMTQKMGQITKEQAEAFEKMFMSPALMGISAISSLIQFFIMLVIVGLVVFGILKLLRVDAKISKCFAILSLSYITVAIGSVAKGVVMLATNKPMFANFKPTALNILLSNLDIFLIWFYILMYVGIKKVFDTDDNKSILTVVILWLLTLGFSFLSLLMFKK